MSKPKPLTGPEMVVAVAWLIQHGKPDKIFDGKALRDALDKSKGGQAMSARKRPTGDVRIADPATGASIDVETAIILRHDSAGWSAALRAVAAMYRRMGETFSVYDLWKLVGRKNPARVEGSRAAGEAVALRLSKTQRTARASAGGLALMHGSDGHDPGRARTVARQLQRLQAATRRGEHAPVKKNRLDVSRSKLRGLGEDHNL